MSGLLLHARWPRCGVRGCGAPVDRFVEVRLPATWATDSHGGDLAVLVGACWRDAADLERRQRALRSARRDLQAQARVLADAVKTTASLRRDLARARETSNEPVLAPRDAVPLAARSRGNGR